MTEEKLNYFLTILDKYEISLDVDEFELSLLSDDLVESLTDKTSKLEIVEIIMNSINDLRNRLKGNNLRSNISINHFNVVRTSFEHPLYERTGKRF